MLNSQSSFLNDELCIRLVDVVSWRDDHHIAVSAIRDPTTRYQADRELAQACRVDCGCDFVLGWKRRFCSLVFNQFDLRIVSVELSSPPV